MLGILLKIIFVPILIFTGIESSLFNIADFCQPREAKRVDTLVTLQITFSIVIETCCKYF